MNKQVREYTEDDIGQKFTIVTPEGTYIEQEIVRYTCFVCGESMIGTIRSAGGFAAAHRIYHEEELQLARLG